jgi:hypothetical protein
MLASVCTETKSSVRVPCTVGQATPSPSLPMLHVARQTVRPVLPPSLYHPQGRTVRPYYGRRAFPGEDNVLTVDVAYWDACNRLNSRAGVFALSLATWHGLRIVSRAIPSRTILSRQDEDDSRSCLSSLSYPCDRRRSSNSLPSSRRRNTFPSSSVTPSKPSFPR